MNTIKFGYLLMNTVAVASMVGCSNEQPPEKPPLDLEVQNMYNSGPNKPFVNGRPKDGKQVNGILSTGRRADGRQVYGKFDTNVLNNEPISLIFIDTTSGATYKGADLIGIETSGQLSDGSMRQIHFKAYDAISVPATNLYLVAYVDSGESVCGDREGQPIWAAILPQIYDENTGNEVASDPTKYTFSCRFGAIQRCQEVGYVKNGTGFESNGTSSRTRNLNDYHAACVKMLRADYCGNGKAHTFEGTTVDFYDHLVNGNKAKTGTTGQDGYYLESDWDIDGAHCLNATRWMPASLNNLAMNQSSANPDWEYVRLNCPERFAYPVPIANSGLSVPDRACGALSNWNTSVGFSMYVSNAPTQMGRSKIRTNTMLNGYNLQ